MKTTMDRFGRIGIPEKIRQQFHMEAGTELVIIEQENGILLRLVDEASSLKREGKLLVFTGDILEDVSDIINRQRNNRMAQMSDYQVT